MDKKIYIEYNTLEELKFIEEHFNKLGIYNPSVNIYNYYKLEYGFFEDEKHVLQIDFEEKSIYSTGWGSKNIINGKYFMRKIKLNKIYEL